MPPWTIRHPAEGRAYLMIKRESHPRGKICQRGYVYTPEGWGKLVALGWIRADRPIRPMPPEPLARVPERFKN